MSRVSDSMSSRAYRNLAIQLVGESVVKKIEQMRASSVWTAEMVKALETLRKMGEEDSVLRPR